MVEDDISVTKKCVNCEEVKPLSLFSFKDKKAGKMQPRCKDCNKIDQLRHYDKDRLRVSNRYRKDEYRNWMHALKSQPCADCGHVYDPVCMDFDHLRDKKFNLCVGFHCGYSRARIEEELSKCVVVCANCHRLRTKIRYNEK